LNGRFDTAPIAQYGRRFPGFVDKIIGLYAGGMITRDIQGHVRERYGIVLRHCPRFGLSLRA
jgi:putative transposase